jgi:hypothetical protein
LTLQFRTGDIHYAFISATGEPFPVGISSRVLRQLSEWSVFWDDGLCPHTDCNVQFRTVQHKPGSGFAGEQGRFSSVMNRRTQTSIHLDASQSAVILSVFKFLRPVASAYDCNEYCGFT